MKKILFISLITLVVSACSNNKNVDTQKLIDSKDLQSIKSHREKLQLDYEKLGAEIQKLDEAIGNLDTLKKYPLVKTMVLKDSSFTHFIEIKGSIDTKENIVITPEFSGVLSQINVKAGQKVNKGQILARIDDGGLSAQVSQAETQLALMKTTFDRQKNLWDQKIGSEIQFLQAKTNWESQQKNVSYLKSQLAKTVVTAPFSGTIDEVITEKGQVVSPQSQLFRIVNLRDMYVKADVPESYLGKLKNGANVEVYLNAIGKTYVGKVRQIGNFINPNNRTFNIEIAIPNQDDLLRPNQVAILKIEDYTNPKAVLIPENILGEAADGSRFVYVVKNKDAKNNAVSEMVTIEIGNTSGAFVEIKKGLESGIEVITEGSRSIRNNAKVTIIE
jgi:membrane fusion protein, multidrug efflux system